MARAIITLAVIIALSIFVMGHTLHTAMLCGLILPLLLLWIGLRLHGKDKARRVLDNLRNGWGRQVARDRDFDVISELHRLSQADTADGTATIDDHTWLDLNMDDVYAVLDRTLTTPGEAVLYDMLRRPLLSNDALQPRRDLIRLFQSSSDAREDVQKVLVTLGKRRGRGAVQLLWMEYDLGVFLKRLSRVLASLAFLWVLALPLLLPLAWGRTALVISMLVLLCANMALHYHVRVRLVPELGSIRYISAMIQAAGRLSSLPREGLRAQMAGLAGPVKRTRRIVRKTAALFPERSTLMLDALSLLQEYINIFFLLEVRAFWATMDGIHANRSDLKIVFKTIGELDTLQSIASYRTEQTYCEPRLGVDRHGNDHHHGGGRYRFRLSTAKGHQSQ